MESIRTVGARISTSHLVGGIIDNVLRSLFLFQFLIVYRFFNLIFLVFFGGESNNSMHTDVFARLKVQIFCLDLFLHILNIYVVCQIPLAKLSGKKWTFELEHVCL